MYEYPGLEVEFAAESMRKRDDIYVYRPPFLDFRDIRFRPMMRFRMASLFFSSSLTGSLGLGAWFDFFSCSSGLSVRFLFLD
jgi:hypothetical protein